MTKKRGACTALFYFFVTCLWGICYGFVLLSSAAGAGGVPVANVFKVGGAWDYHYQSTVLLDENGAVLRNKSVGFSVSGDLTVEAIWGGAEERLLKFELKSPRLSIRSRKAPAPDGFVQHASKLDGLKNHPFYVHWNKGRVEKILLVRGETTSLANIKKGIASLFQFQLSEQEIEETDSSGRCVCAYTSSTVANNYQKVKTNCLSPDLPLAEHPEPILGAKIESTRSTGYHLDDSDEFFVKIEARERHLAALGANEDVGGEIDASVTLTFVESRSGSSSTIDAGDVEGVIDEISKRDGATFTRESLLTEREAQDEPVGFAAMVAEYKEALKTDNLGTLPPAKAFVNLVTAGRKARKDDIAKALVAKKNKAILYQLYDILGYVQTADSHAAVVKTLHFDDRTQEDASERYLWALSLAPHPNGEIALDLLDLLEKNTGLPEKVRETMVLSVASMGYRLSRLPSTTGRVKATRLIEEAILNGLDYSKGGERLVYLRALRNLRSGSTIPKLLEVVAKGTPKEGVLAWKAISVTEPSLWESLGVLKAAFKTFHQLDKKHDSSARALAVDVILAAKPDDETLAKLLRHLRSEDKAFEIKQYLWQKLRMMAEKDTVLRERIASIVKTSPELNNYDVLAQKGLSLALTRDFLSNPSSNGSLLTVQEMFGGIVKTGVVNVVMNKDGRESEIFSLGIFSGGLSSFLSSDSEGDSDETAVAGMELAVLGTQIRPFTFFNGQGELMGHVWSGTASERTTAFQALAILQDHQQYLRLGPGFIAELDVKGGTSFDLAGRIEFSLWNRNAESLVEKSAGIIVSGSAKVDNSFVRSTVEFAISLEPKLNLQTDIDFSSNVNLCMRLTQPDAIFRHSVYKIERIIGSKHKLRIAKHKKSLVPGKTYSLNKKNNDMCTSMFKLF